jgi:hypothetical protein
MWALLGYRERNDIMMCKCKGWEKNKGERGEADKSKGKKRKSCPYA